jgi:hypothetical protein
MKETRVVRTVILAEQICKFTNPCILSLLLLLTMLFTLSTSPGVLAGSSLTIFLILVAAPLLYVYLRTARERVSGHRMADPTLFLKRHPRSILALGIVCGLPAWLLLKTLNAPPEMLYAMIAFLATALAVALFNLFYRVSFHLAALTTLILMAVFTWGLPFIILAAAVPMVGWAKYVLYEHTPAQMVLGIATAIAVTSGLVYGVWS